MKETIFYRESLIQSIIADLASFFLIGVTFWFNYNFIDGNNFIDLFLLIVIISFVANNKVKKVFHSKKELLDYINKEIKE